MFHGYKAGLQLGRYGYKGQGTQGYVGYIVTPWLQLVTQIGSNNNSANHSVCSNHCYHGHHMVVW